MYDAIVVGARCAGSAIALLLARQGLRILLLDRARFPSDMPMSTHLVHPRGVACLARWGLHDALVATGAPAIAKFDIDLGPFTLSGCAPPVDGEHRAYAPRRLLLDGLLVRAAQDGGAELREECSVQSLLFDGDRVVGVRGASKGGALFTERARIVIGADGPSSTIAAEVDAEEYNTRPPLQGTGWIYWDGIPLAGLELHLRDYEAVYAFPSSGCTLIGVNWAIDRFQEARRHPESSYFEVLHRAAPALAERARAAKRTEQRLHLGSTRNFFRKACGPGWVLLGDAHFKKDPCTAQGITDAFGDAEALAAVLGPALRGETADLEHALAHYEQERVAWATPYYELSCEMARFAPPPPEMLPVYVAMQHSQPDIDRFLGLITEAESPAAFFDPTNLGRIVQAGATTQH